MIEIEESDWKRLRRLMPLALDRFCQRALRDVQNVCSATDQTSHERFRRVYSLVHNQNEELSHAFDDSRRSNALIQLALIRASNLITPEEFAEFSDETRARIELFLGNGTAAKPNQR